VGTVGRLRGLAEASAVASHGLPICSSPGPYAVGVAGAGSVILASHAFRAGPLFASQSSLTLVDPLASILVGMEQLGEHLQTAPKGLAIECMILELEQSVS